MADKVDKPKKQKAKAKQGDKGVLAALPSTRPERIGSRRDATAKPAKPAAKPAKAAVKPAKAAAKPSATRATATRRKAAAPRTFEPTEAAEAAAGAADERAAGAVPRAETPPVREAQPDPRPRAVSEGAPGIGSTGSRDGEPEPAGRAGGAELATTAVRAAGEVAQLGLTIGGEVLKRVVNRLPRP